MRIVKDPVDRRNEIIAAARELFFEVGFEKTTIESIIKKLGVAKGCFYHYFKSKDEVFEACIEEKVNLVLGMTKQILLNESKSVKERLVDYIEFSFQEAEIHHNHDVLASFQGKAFQNLHERVLEDGIRLMTPIFVALIKQGQDNAELSVLNVDFTAIALLGAFKRIHSSYHERPDMNLQQQKAYVYDLMERVLKIKF